MRYASLPALLALALLSATPKVHAQAGPQPGTCILGDAQADLNTNDVFARVFNTGSLFFGNQTIGGEGYVVPQASGFSSVFASGLWVGGQTGDDNTLRVAGSRYESFNFWPGPLAANGRPVDPNNCEPFDRIYSVTVTDIFNTARGNPAPDAAEWPVELGAPYFIDTNGDDRRNADEPRLFREDGDTRRIDYNAGERPDIVGDQGIWWVMNDVGGPHAQQNTPPLGIEVRVLAFSFTRSDALGQTTFYRYAIINKSGQDIRNTYVSIFADPDLGFFEDDFVGSDPEAGLGFVYNGDDVDEQYGVPPALGYDFFQGPIVADRGSPGDAGCDEIANCDNDALDDTLGTSAISYFQNINDPAIGDPATGVQIYNYMRGLWGDGTQMRASGDGYDEPASSPTTVFMFPGDPVTGEAWSEVNPGNNTPNVPDDRRFAIHTGPFVLENGAEQDIVFGIVFAQGGDRFSSITALRQADAVAQTAYDADFQLAPPPPSPPLCVERDDVIFPGSGNCLEQISVANRITLVWGYPPTSSNYLGQFQQEDPLLEDLDVPDKVYDFEGFNVYRYPNSNFSVSERELVATYDIVNGVQIVRENMFDPQLGLPRLFVTARGSDSGLEYSFDIEGLTNFQDYFYGVSAYAYNEFSIPKVNESQPTNITVRPTNLVSGIETQSTFGDTLIVSRNAANGGEGDARVTILDPTQLTGDDYEVRFFRPTNVNGTVSAVTTYSVTNTTTGQIVVDGQENYNRTGRAISQGGFGQAGQDVGVSTFQGIQIDLEGSAEFETFVTVANAAGPIDPPIYAATRQFRIPGQQDPEPTNFPFIPDSLGTPNGTPVDEFGPGGGQQGSASRFSIHQGLNPESVLYEEFLPIVIRADNTPAVGTTQYEWRFTGTSRALRLFQDGGSEMVPFELWNIGTTPSDRSDDFRMIPVIRSLSDTTDFGLQGIDHTISVGDNDPFTDPLYWYNPVNATPGEQGYLSYAISADTTGNVNRDAIGQQVFAELVLVGVNAGNVPGPYARPLPEEGTIFRMVTKAAYEPGDSFTFSTANFESTTPTEEGQRAALDRIAAVPNPYLGSSTYETGNVSRVVRFTNLPEQVATIRIFTVAGSLVNTLRKEGSNRTLDWDLTTSQNLPVASGMYLVHVEIDGVGERTLKLGIINRRTQIRAF